MGWGGTFARKRVPGPAASADDFRGLAPAVEPGLGVLEGVVCCPAMVCARHRVAVRVADHVGVDSAVRAELLEALLHEVVLAPAVPVEVVLALLPVVQVEAHGLLREDL